MISDTFEITDTLFMVTLILSNVSFFVLLSNLLFIFIVSTDSVGSVLVGEEVEYTFGATVMM